jgi:hypothetical protein
VSSIQSRIERLEERIIKQSTPLPEWTPLPGPQTLALESPADFIFMGGAAGGGKSDLLLGVALTLHNQSIIFRREYPQLKAIEDRAREIVSDRGQYNGQTHAYKLGQGHVLEFGAVQHPGDEQAFLGRPHDFKGFDEVTHFHESQFRFLIGWLRTTKPGHR